jgi:hypothetical protein
VLLPEEPVLQEPEESERFEALELVDPSFLKLDDPLIISFSEAFFKGNIL